MKPTIKREVAAGALIAGLALSGAGVAMAATNGATGPNGTTTAAGDPAGAQVEASGQEQNEAQEHEAGTQEQDPSYTGSVIAPQDNGTEGQDTEPSEADEAKNLQSLATTTPEQARAAALAAVPGTAGAVELDNENGYVVYSVQVTGADGNTVDVKVDAGNATVLAQDTDTDTETNDD